MGVTFVLNGQTVTTEASPTTTLLDWLRLTRGLTGTKEGCNEGDCGACTVAVQGPGGLRALNACILFLPQLQGAVVTTVEGLSGDDGGLHPVQQAMIDHHGAQCGFCTPGFIMAMAVAHAGGDRAHDDALAGNLCRCTGYAPIIRAAVAAADVPAQWGREPAQAPDPAPGAPPDRSPQAVGPAPRSADELAAHYLAHPDATLIAGATDVGLWVTKGLKDLKQPVFLSGCADLKTITRTGDNLHIGAMATMADALVALRPLHPSYAELIRRYGSPQVRAAATMGGNIANGSPIGDNPPALIAIGATLHLRRGDERRDMPIESFYIAYGKQDRRPGEFVTGVTLPAVAPDFRVWKISKRFDQDISAVCGAFNITVADGRVTAARIAFGGMAGIPKRAAAVEGALIGQPWTRATITAALPAFAADFAPLSDMRAGAAYRLTVAQNLLVRYFHDRTGAPAHVLEVAP